MIILIHKMFVKNMYKELNLFYNIIILVVRVGHGNILLIQPQQ